MNTISDQLLRRQRALRGAKIQKWRRRGIKGGGTSGGIFPGFPGANNTGPQAGTILTLSSGELLTTTPGQTIQNLNLTGYIIVRHNNTTIQDCIINLTGFDPTQFFWNISASTPTTGTIIRRCRIIGNSSNSAIETENMSGAEVSFCDISGMENGIFIGSNAKNLHDNYIHDLTGLGDPHIDGIQGTGGFTSLTINHNNILSRDTSCIILQNETAGFSGVTITNNRLIGQSALGYGILCQKKPGGSGGAVDNITVTGNRFGGNIQFFAAQFVGVTNLTFTGNVDDATGLPITADIS
jgi:hypothetical protein